MPKRIGSPLVHLQRSLTRLQWHSLATLLELPVPKNQQERAKMLKRIKRSVILINQIKAVEL